MAVIPAAFNLSAVLLKGSGGRGMTSVDGGWGGMPACASRGLKQAQPWQESCGRAKLSLTAPRDLWRPPGSWLCCIDSCCLVGAAWHKTLLLPPALAKETLALVFYRDPPLKNSLPWRDFSLGETFSEEILLLVETPIPSLQQLPCGGLSHEVTLF